MLDAMELAHQSIQEAIRVQNEMQAAIGKPKSDYPRFGTPEALSDRVNELMLDRVRHLVDTTELKGERVDALDALEDELKTALADEAEANGWSSRLIGGAFHDVLKAVVRERILDKGIRPDGRDQSTLRALDAEVHLVPRPHGSGLFTRGETQVMSLATLGMPGEEQSLDDLFPQDTKRYIHHYNFPPFSTGETWPLRGPRRREIGHGALAERALLPVIPAKDVFPYTLRVVSEVMSSNGSTSMASTCAST